MTKEVLITVLAEIADDMPAPIDSEELHTAETMDFEEVLRGFGIAPSAASQWDWWPVNLSDEDYAEKRNLGLEWPDYVPLPKGSGFSPRPIEFRIPASKIGDDCDVVVRWKFK